VFKRGVDVEGEGLCERGSGVAVVSGGAFWMGGRRSEEGCFLLTEGVCANNIRVAETK